MKKSPLPYKVENSENNDTDPQVPQIKKPGRHSIGSGANTQRCLQWSDITL